VRTTLAWLPATAIAALIFLLSGIPGLHATDGLTELVLRKGAHLTIYAALTVAIAFALGRHGLDGRRRVVGALLLAALYAISDEIHQAFVRDRHGTPVDVLIDTVGATAGLVLLASWTRRRRPGGGAGDG
jgi:VanZ family protein